jgi:glycosyltransferase EpsF
MRVLHLINAFNRGGVEKWLLNMLEAVPRHSCEFDVCCKGAGLGPWAPRAVQSGARIYHCPLRPSQIGFIRRLRGILRENQYDLVHNHLGIYAGLAVWVAQNVGTPIVTTFHSSTFPAASELLALPGLSQLRRLYAHFSLKYAIRHSDMLTAVSTGVLDDMVPRGSAQRQKSAAIHLGIEIPALATDEEKASFRASMGWQARTPLVVHVGRFFKQKNHFGLLAIFERALRQVPEAKLLLVGVGPLAERVEEHVRNRGLSNAVRMLGARDDAASIISRCDVLLFPSLWEGFGIVALEANAAGIPVVGSNVVGLNEAVEDGRTALLWDVHDEESMAASVVRILNDHEYARTLGQAGRIRAEQLFSTKASAERLIRIYQELISRQKPQPRQIPATPRNQ